MQHGPLQIQFELLALDIATAVGSQYTQLCVTGADATALEVDAAALVAVQAGIQGQVLQMIVGKCQLLAIKRHFALRCLEGSAYIDTALELTAQFGPQLAQTRHIEIKLGLDLLLQTGGAIDAVIAQANIQRTDRPGFTRTVGLGLQHRRQAAQTALEVKVGIQFQALVFERTLAAQRACQRTRQLSHPVRRVEPDHRGPP